MESKAAHWGENAGFFAGNRDGVVRPVIVLRLSEQGGTSETTWADSSQPCAIGSYITFGRCEQGEGPKEIEWLVLENDGERATLISRYALDCKPYNTNYTDVTWEKCSLREWLNNEFLNTVFNGEELARLETATIAADANPDYPADSGNATRDRVFLPSIVEANGYFAGNKRRICHPTEYAVSQGAQKNDGACGWWLRSRGERGDSAAWIDITGNVSCSGLSVNYEKLSVRPMVVIKL